MTITMGIVVCIVVFGLLILLVYSSRGPEAAGANAPSTEIESECPTCSAAMASDASGAMECPVCHYRATM